MKKWPKVNLEFALMADGVPPEQVYEVLSTPEGVERAFAKLDSIKDHVIWWEAGAQPVQLLADGEVAMTTAFNGRVYTAMVDEGQPFEIVWDGQVWDLDLWTVVDGTKKREAAMDFVAFASRPERMAEQPNYISYGPVRKSALAMVPEDVKPHLPTFPENFENSVQNDYEWWADNLDAMNVRFNAWLAQ
jgi:putative spermidine/putrescine transport system substrate-binding protein